MYSCKSYCSHGGRCELEPGHEGQHDSSYCQWSDDEALSKEDADKILRDKFGNNSAVDTIIELT